MPQPSGSSTFSPLLTNAAIAYMQDRNDFVADQVLPRVPVAKETGVYYKFGKEFLRDDAQLREGAQESAGSGFTLSTESFFIPKWSLHKDFSIDDKARFNADAVLDWRRSGTELVTKQLLIRREREFAASIMASGVWATDTTPSNLWSDHVNSDPVDDVEGGKQTVLLATGNMPNTLVVDYRVDRQLRNHPQVRGRLGVENPQNATRADVARALGVDRYFVIQAVYNTADEGQTFSGSFVTGKDAVLLYAPPSASIMTPTAAMMLANTGVTGSSEMAMREIDLPERNQTTRIEGDLAVQFKVTASDLGYRFGSVVA